MIVKVPKMIPKMNVSLSKVLLYKYARFWASWIPWFSIWQSWELSCCERRGLNTESKAYKQCIFCDYVRINDNKKYKKENNYFTFTPKMNYFTRLIREMNVKYEGDNTLFLTMEETECIRKMFKGLLLYIPHNCHFQGNINTRYWINKIMDYLEIKLELRIKHRVSKKACKKLDDLFSK